MVEGIDCAAGQLDQAQARGVADQHIQELKRQDLVALEDAETGNMLQRNQLAEGLAIFRAVSERRRWDAVSSLQDKIIELQRG